ncbi:MAG TPA: Rne/Rng family ribonuclease [Mycobacteriales bacterium]|nr:Rne/Rng family ribonuclease [Mycobacteriales bacterium]
MLDDERTNETPTDSAGDVADTPAPPKRRAARRPAGPPTPAEDSASAPEAPAAADAAAERPAPAKRTRKKAAAPAAAEAATDEEADAPAPTRRRRTSAAAKAAEAEADATEAPAPAMATPPPPVVLFQAPVAAPAPARRSAPPAVEDDEAAGDAEGGFDSDADTDDDGAPRTSRRRRGRRGRGGRPAGEGSGEDESPATEAAAVGSASTPAEGGDAGNDEGDEGGTGTHRRRRRRRSAGAGGADGEQTPDDPPNTVVHVREPRQASDDVRGVKGSTRIEAKRQRRRDGRETQRRRPSIITEAEFLARREAVERVMVVKQGEDRTQIAVLEDNVLVEHYVTRKHASSMVGNVYLGKVQNVLPSMEAAFVDIGRGRNAVLYAGEVNYDASALEGGAPRIEQALKSGQSVLVQVTKDPIGQKGARLTSQVSLPGRYMVYVPDGKLSGISRKLPDTERTRLKSILKRLMPEDAGVIIRTAAEGASEEALERDLNRLKAQWEDIEKKVETAAAPSLIYGEPDLVIRVVRDIFNEDFTSLVVQGADEWETIDNYVRWVAPDLAERTRRWTEDEDVFASYRIDEQLAKALDRKVWLPSGGYLVIDRTEAMVVVDVNTGKFTGKGGNLEETVTKNNIEAAEEIVRQLRLRDLGGIIVIDFIDMVLESNRDLVLRRLIECLGRDRTRHQVAEVTSLGLVQMTRKRVGEGLLESFSETCKECGGSGVILTHDPVAAKRPPKPKRAKSGEHRHNEPAPAPEPVAAAAEV